MGEIHDIPEANPEVAQAAALLQLVELEARWENLRAAPVRLREGQATTQDLHGRQKAYDTFRTRLAVYNKRYRPAYVAEALLNTPAKLGAWCRMVHDLYLRVAHEPQGYAPAHVLEKAYRWAERVAAKLGTTPVNRPAPADDLRTAAGNLQTLAQWCLGMTGITPAA